MLKKLIAPLSVQAFVDNFHSQLAYYGKGDAERFEDLFQWADVNECLANARTGDQFIRLIGEEGPGPYLSQHKLSEHISQGKTIVINSLQDVDPVIRAFCEDLSSELNTCVTVNCYVSNPSAQGFKMHYDAHDVFIVQTEGCKRWHVHPASELWPIDKYHSDMQAPNTKPYLDVVLKPGDILYIPRGHWHIAKAIEPCVHLTVTVPSTNGSIFLKDLLTQLADNMPILRKELPLYNIKSLGGSLSDAKLDHDLQEMADAMITVLADKARLKQFLLEYSVCNRLVKKDIALPQLGDINTKLTRTTKLIRQPRQVCLIKKLNESSTKVVVSGHQFLIEDVPNSFVQALLDESKVITGNALIEQAELENTPLAWDDLKSILITLVNKGVLQLR